MNMLPNFPHISQRDGDINSVDDCVAASIAMGLEYLTGKKYTAGEVKDAVYGASYTGGTAAVRYEQYCADQGVTLAPINGNGGQLVAALKSEISAGHPCVVTEPDPYEAGWSHCCAAFAFNNEAATITVVDPWIDANVTKTEAVWSTQLLFSQIWTLKKKGDSTMPVPIGWKDDGTTLTAPNAHKVVKGFREAILSAQTWNPQNTPNEEEYGTSQVLLHNPTVGAGTRQTFRDGMYWWTQAHGATWEPFTGLELKACYDLIEQLQKAAPAPAPSGDSGQWAAQAEAAVKAAESSIMQAMDAIGHLS